jgi:hypothetical protein
MQTSIDCIKHHLFSLTLLSQIYISNIQTALYILIHQYLLPIRGRRRRGCDCMVVGFTYTYAKQCLSPLQLWFRMPGGVLDTTLCDKFISDLQRVGGFPCVLRFSPSIPPRYNWNIVESGDRHHYPLTLSVVYYMDQVSK